MAGRRRRGGHEHHEEHPDERWLLTYADMITLLLALFIVLFAMADPNPKKTEEAAKSLKEALNGQILPGGESIAATGGQADTTQLKQQPPSPSLQEALQSGPTVASPEAAAQEEQSLKQLKSMVDAAAAEAKLRGKVETKLSKDGLTIRVLSDDLLFDSGSAVLKPESAAIMRRISRVLRIDGVHAVRVSGHTDSVPVSGRYPSNWELSTARASAVVRALARNNVAPARMEASGKAHLAPVASNDAARGRSKNRRVEILLPRQKLGLATSETTSN